jgi:hypothetical protein
MAVSMPVAIPKIRSNRIRVSLDRRKTMRISARSPDSGSFRGTRALAG